MAAAADSLSRARQLLAFIDASPSPFHAVHEAKTRLLAAGYQELKERDPWALVPLGKYFFTRNHSTIIAFAVGGKFQAGNGFSILGAHTDSPCLRIKPSSCLTKSGYLAVGVEPYGGGLWHTWFDRDLTIGGRVLVSDDKGLSQKLVHVDRPIMRIPNLAIHLTPAEERGAFKFNKETELVPVIATTVKASLEKPAEGKHHAILIDLLAKELGVESANIKDFELCLADFARGAIGGITEEFIFSPRLDNLMSSFCGLQALIEAEQLDEDENTRVLALFDHEEVGSESAQGAASALTEYVLRRLSTPKDAPIGTLFEQAIPKSMLISADMAHGVHPNYSEKHESQHRPSLHGGPVIKFNTNQRYATNAVTAALLREFAARGGVPVQDFVVRNDSPCGSTIGPIMSARLGMRTVDVGNPQLSMHSIREMCGTSSVGQAIDLFKSYFVNFAAVDKTINID
eukprot:m.231075 g.231075  ORF g.231075 m.231075 type:complete len:457 (+) comp12160_c0_seq1:35-1405(+)